MTDCKFCGGTKELSGFGYAPEPCPACAGTGKANPFAPLETPGWTEVTKPVPDPRVTALVTAARELIAAFDANANAPVTDEYWIALYAKKRALTAALEAFPND